MAQRVCVVVDSAERGLLPDDCHRRACSSFSILHGGKTGLPGARETLVTIPGGHAKANGRGGSAPARHRSSIWKRESATRGRGAFGLRAQCGG